MPYDHTNLAQTVYAGQSPAARKYREMQRCKVWRKKKFPPFFVLDGDPHKKEDSRTNYHEWNKVSGLCVHCGLTPAEARGIKKKDSNSLAREIGNVTADVPPVRFIGEADRNSKNPK